MFLRPSCAYKIFVMWGSHSMCMILSEMAYYKLNSLQTAAFQPPATARRARRLLRVANPDEH